MKQKIRKECEICKKEFYVIPYRASAKYCDRKCFAKARRRVKMKKACDNCSEIFYVVKSSQERRFCNRECYHEGREEPWNKGLTKNTDTRLIAISNKSREQMKREYADGTRDKYKITKAANEALRKRTRDRLEQGVLNKKEVDGYIYVYLPERQWVAEHRYFWEKHNGRKVPAGFHFHHKNGNGKDNRIENLELISASEHSKHHYPERSIGEDGRFI